MKDQNYKKYYELKDKCRNELICYLQKALSVIPEMNNPRMLDVGCGTGVPTFALANTFGGFVKAIDSDIHVLNYLQGKIKEQKLIGEIEIINTSLFDLARMDEFYDIILAEGILNIVGFEKGLSALVQLAKKETFLIIHDEYSNIPEKLELFNQYDCKLLKTIFLSENIWWNNYYKHLELQISQITDNDLLELFEPDRTEIQKIKTNPELFRSVYFVVKYSSLKI